MAEIPSLILTINVNISLTCSSTIVCLVPTLVILCILIFLILHPQPRTPKHQRLFLLASQILATLGFRVSGLRFRGLGVLGFRVWGFRVWRLVFWVP